MNTSLAGQKAETAVIRYLENKRYQLLARNWRTRVCEIDLVMKKKKTVVFVEVKYRSQSLQGKGFDYITPQKLRQMRFAAETWVYQHDWKGEWLLAAAEVTGPDYEIDFIDLVT